MISEHVNASSSRLRPQVESVVQASLARIRQHPFILDAERRVLSHSQAVRWIFCAGRESRTFPAILENMITRTRNRRIQEILQANLDDEYGNGNPDEAHFKHYQHLLEELEIPLEMFDRYAERDGIRLALGLAHSVSTHSSEALAIGYMLVNEGMTAITYSAVQTALRKFYSELRTPFFKLHVEVDDRHIAELYTALEELGHDQLEDVLYGVAIGERGMAVLLDEAYGVFGCWQYSAVEGRAS